ncbi:MAG: OmpH family outer membrane protein [Bacteroidales bacterium]|jgi:outer membrane protein|nr:OmpH family outer membrane protein [Bacteroidales bacterium]
MKKVLLIAFTVFSFTAFAQKFGHIEYSKLVTSMPQYDSAMTTLQAYSKDIEATITTMQTELQNAYQDFQANQNQMTDLIKTTRARAIQDQEARLNEFYKQAQEDVQQQQAKIMQPVLDKAKAAVTEVAKENKYSYIFDTTSEVLLYKPETDDILPLVAKKLGVTVK